jgi:hypothetical protein
MKIMANLVRCRRFADEIMQMSAAEKESLLAGAPSGGPTQLSRQ